jgi:hypothetical protein
MESRFVLLPHNPGNFQAPSFCFLDSVFALTISRIGQILWAVEHSFTLSVPELRVYPRRALRGPVSNNYPTPQL